MVACCGHWPVFSSFFSWPLLSVSTSCFRNPVVQQNRKGLAGREVQLV